MNERRTTNILLLIIALPVIFYILSLLSFIFIPLSFSMFIAMVFMPLMRWLRKRKIPNSINLVIVVLIILVFFRLAGELVHLSTLEILGSNNDIFDKAESKLNTLITPVEVLFGVERVDGIGVIPHYFQKLNVGQKFGESIDVLGKTISMSLMTAFFAILLLAESLNFQVILNTTIIKQRYSSVKVFMQIEKDLLTFIKVKFAMSFFTGLGFTLACLFFDVSFPIFWGLLAFLLNFIQMIGSVVSIVILALFAMVELDTTSVLFFFIITIILVQVIIGGVLEPIFMGKSFKINVITILMMLMFWGFVWGVPGMILSIPITVFLKIIFEQFSRTKVLADLMSGSDLMQTKT